MGTDGYIRPDGTRQKRALAFQGTIVMATGVTNVKVFIADLPEDLTQSGGAAVAGTATTRPSPPRGVTQRRLTFTAERKFPGLQGTRHWLRSSPDGSLIAFLMKDDAGIVQFWTLSPNGGAPAQLTLNPWPIASSFTWSLANALRRRKLEIENSMHRENLGRGRPDQNDRPAASPRMAGTK